MRDSIELMMSRPSASHPSPDDCPPTVASSRGPSVEDGSTENTSPVCMSEYQSRPSCQRFPSGKRMPEMTMSVAESRVMCTDPACQRDREAARTNAVTAA